MSRSAVPVHVVKSVVRCTLKLDFVFRASVATVKARRLRTPRPRFRGLFLALTG